MLTWASQGSHWTHTGPLYLDGDLLQKYIKHAHGRTEQEVYICMTTSEIGLPVTQEREEVQCWRNIVEDRPVARFLATVITAYIRGLQDKGTVLHGKLPVTVL